MAQLTQRAIRGSMMRLLNERPLEKITVKDIVEDCGINRNTFYYHYRDVYDLLSDIFETEAERITNGDSDVLIDSWQSVLIRSAEFALANKRAIYNVYNSINRDMLERHLDSVSEHSVKLFVEHQSEGLDVSPDDKQIIITVYKHAASGIILEWLQRGMKDDPELFIKRAGDILEGSVRDALVRACETR